MTREYGLLKQCKAGPIGLRDVRAVLSACLSRREKLMHNFVCSVLLLMVSKGSTMGYTFCNCWCRYGNVVANENIVRAPGNDLSLRLQSTSKHCICDFMRMPPA